jgi:hypothetical protein
MSHRVVWHTRLTVSNIATKYTAWFTLAQNLWVKPTYVGIKTKKMCAFANQSEAQRFYNELGKRL